MKTIQIFEFSELNDDARAVSRDYFFRHFADENSVIAGIGSDIVSAFGIEHVDCNIRMSDVNDGDVLIDLVISKKESSGESGDDTLTSLAKLAHDNLGHDHELSVSCNCNHIGYIRVDVAHIDDQWDEVCRASFGYNDASSVGETRQDWQSLFASSIITHVKDRVRKERKFFYSDENVTKMCLENGIMFTASGHVVFE